MTQSTVRMRQVMDVSAAVWGGVVGGAVFLLVQIIMTTGPLSSTVWVPFRWNAAIILGQDVLPPPSGFAFGPVLVGLIVHFALSILFSLLIAFVIHRGGLVMGIVGGALLGLCLYAFNYFTLTAVFPWFFAIRSWIMALGHILFGAVAGGIYEGLEVESFEPVEE